MPFIFEKTDIPDVLVIAPKVFEDERGFFTELYKEKDFFDAGIKEKFIQENLSYSKKNVLRGLHFQISPFSQAKIIRVAQGEVFDVAVDIRENSPTFKKWIGIILSKDNKKMIYIPEGFAHGFCVLSDSAEIIYKCSNPYSPKHERGIIWNDSDLAIKWPIENPILSSRDANWPNLKNLISEI